jgi:hypothetical protein
MEEAVEPGSDTALVERVSGYPLPFLGAQSLDGHTGPRAFQVEPLPTCALEVNEVAG